MFLLIHGVGMGAGGAEVVVPRRMMTGYGYCLALLMVVSSLG